MDWIKRIFSVSDGDEPSGNHGGPSECGALSCREALEVLYEYLDGELEDLQTEQAAAHFRLCQRCYPHVNFERAFLAAVRRAADCSSAPEDLKTRLMRALEEEGLEAR